VIKAINEDLPYDQLWSADGGDMLPGATPSQKIATGFHRNTMFNEEGGIDVEEFRYKSVGGSGAARRHRVPWPDDCTAPSAITISTIRSVKGVLASFFALLNNTDEPKFNVPDQAIDQQRREVSAKLEKLTSELASKFPARDESIQWEVLTPEQYTAESGAKLTVQADKALSASGKVRRRTRMLCRREVTSME
jgi:hypothetical protein